MKDKKLIKLSTEHFTKAIELFKNNKIDRKKITAYYGPLKIEADTYDDLFNKLIKLCSDKNK